MTTSPSQPERSSAGQERYVGAAGEPVVTTSAERYVMSGGRTPRLAIKEGDLFLYSDALGQASGSENSALGLFYHDTRYLLSLIHISEPTRLGMISYAVFCL